MKLEQIISEMIDKINDSKTLINTVDDDKNKWKTSDSKISRNRFLIKYML